MILATFDNFEHSGNMSFTKTKVVIILKSV